MVLKEDNKLEDIELGSLLKQARQEKGLSLEDIQEETKIRKKYLEAIEENNFDLLPGNVYLKVFVKGYAREVGLNYQDLLKKYEVLHKNEDKKSNLQKDYLNGTKVSNSSKEKDKKNPLKIIFIILLILFLSAAGVYTYQYINNSQIRLLNQQNNQEENIEEESQLLEVEESSENASEDDEEINEEEAVENNSGNETAAELDLFDDNSNSNEGSADDFFDSFDSGVLNEENTEIIDQNNFDELDGLDSQEQNQISEIIVSEEVDNQDEEQSTSENNNLDNQEDESVSMVDETEEVEESDEEEIDSEEENVEEDEQENEEAVVENEIILSASDTVWMTVDLDGNNVFSGVLENGDQREFEIDDRLYIKIGNGSAITAEMGGENYGPWAGNGEIAEVEFLNDGDEITINNLRD